MISVIVSTAREVEPDLRAQAEDVSELDVQIAQRFEESRVRQWPRIDRVEADRLREIEHLLLRVASSLAANTVNC